MRASHCLGRGASPVDRARQPVDNRARGWLPLKATSLLRSRLELCAAALSQGIEPRQEVLAPWVLRPNRRCRLQPMLEAMSLASRPMEKLVLLVEPDEDDGERLGGWLEKSGFGVMECPGPGRVDYTCLGVQGRPCALVAMADLAVLDLRLRGDAFEERARSRRLLRYYLNAGKPVIILGTDRGRRRPYREEGLVLLKSRPSRRTFIDAVRGLLQETA